MQNEQWNFDISEMTISSESSCSLSTATPILAGGSARTGPEQEASSSCDFLTPSISKSDSVEFSITPSGELECVVRGSSPRTHSEVKTLENCDQKCDVEEEVKKEKEAEVAEDDRNELVRLPGGN